MPFYNPKARHRLNQKGYQFVRARPEYGIFWSNNAPHPNLWPIFYATEIAARRSYKA